MCSFSIKLYQHRPQTVSVLSLNVNSLNSNVGGSICNCIIPIASERHVHKKLLKAENNHSWCLGHMWKATGYMSWKNPRARRQQQDNCKHQKAKRTTREGPKRRTRGQEEDKPGHSAQGRGLPLWPVLFSWEKERERERERTPTVNCLRSYAGPGPRW